MGSFECGPGRICISCHDDAQGIDEGGLCPKCRSCDNCQFNGFDNEMCATCCDGDRFSPDVETATKIIRAELAAANAENERLSKRINHLRDMLDDIRHQDSDARSMRVIAATALELDDCSIRKGR